MSLKVCFIGAGSLGFTRRLVRDLLKVEEFADLHIALHDVDPVGLERIGSLLKQDVALNQLPARLTTHLDRKEALEGAKYVFCTVRVGGLEAMEHDVMVPLKYGVDQCVGDTLCAGGLMYAQRMIPTLLDFCVDMKEYCHEDLLFLNYSNPMAMNTWAAIDYGKVNTVGLCHGVQHSHHLIARALGADAHDEVDFIAGGINHQTWFTHIRYQNRKIKAEELYDALFPLVNSYEQCRLDVLKRFGHWCTESNGHLSEYLPWYRRDIDELQNWISDSVWIHGETAGYLKHLKARVDEFEKEYHSMLEQGGMPLSEHERSEEHGSYIIEAIETGRAYRGHFNVRNNGVIPNLPEDCIIEAPGYVDRFGIHMTPLEPLPHACATTCISSINVQRMGMEAAVHGDVMLLKQAMMHDPLVSSVLTLGEIWKMTDEMIQALAEWLPQYTSTDSKQTVQNTSPALSA